MKEEIKTATELKDKTESQMLLRTQALRCLGSVCDKVEQAREKVIMDSGLVA